ncbi:MAG: hypothetical protein OXG04_21405 [Acidobacteria bacterium]|nr:hypothetical protein [Acidobacteriota bacterium]
MRSPLIAVALVLAAVLLAAPPLTAERPAPAVTVDEPHEIKRPGRDIVEYTSERLQVVAVHYYFPEDNDPKWLLIDVAMDVRSGDPIRVARRDFSIEGPDGLRVPLSSLPAFRRGRRALRPMMLQLHTRERPIAGFFPIPCANHNFRFFVPTGEIRQTEVHASWQGSCVRGDLFFEAPDGAWNGGTYTLVIGGDTDIRLPFDID